MYHHEISYTAIKLVPVKVVQIKRNNLPNPSQETLDHLAYKKDLVKKLKGGAGSEVLEEWRRTTKLTRRLVKLLFGMPVMGPCWYPSRYRDTPRNKLSMSQAKFTIV